MMGPVEGAVQELTQVFKNKTDKPIIIMLELSTARYRLAPGEELLLRYKPERVKYHPYDASIVIEFEDYQGGLGMVVHSQNDEMLGPDGQPSKMTCD